MILSRPVDYRASFMAPSMASAPELQNETRRSMPPGASEAEFFGQVYKVLVIEIGPRHVDQIAGLFADGCDDAGMAVAGGHHGDAGVEIEKTIAVDVLDDGAFAAPGDQRIAARVGRRDRTLVARDHFLRAGSRQRPDQIWQILPDLR